MSGVAGWFARGVGCHAPGVGVTDGAVMDTAALQSGRSALMGWGGRGGWGCHGGAAGRLKALREKNEKETDTHAHTR